MVHRPRLNPLVCPGERFGSAPDQAEGHDQHDRQGDGDHDRAQHAELVEVEQEHGPASRIASRRRHRTAVRRRA